MNYTNSEVRVLIDEHLHSEKKAFYSLAQQIGVDPEQILSQLK